MTKWKPIETAERADAGKPLLVWDGESHHVAWFLYECEDEGDMWTNGDVPFHPTHWTTLPPPPEDYP